MNLFQVTERQDLVLGLFLLAAGLVFMLLGVRIYNVLVSLSLGLVGFVIGISMPVPEPTHWVLGVLMAIGLGLVGTFLVRVGVAVLCGGWAAYALIVVVEGLGAMDTICLVIGGAAMLVAVALTFVMYDQMIALVTSLQGCLLFLGGLAVFISQSQGVWSHFRRMVGENPIFGPFLVLAGTVTGLYFQLTELRQKNTAVGM
jgi:hypothetical protein